LAKCSAITQSGTPCKGIPIEGSQWCHAHHPEHAEDRRRNGAKGGKRGGRGRPVYEVSHLKTLLADLTDRVLEGELPTSMAAVANQLINTHLRAIELERKVKETENHDVRLEALEAETERSLKGDKVQWQRR
jgi:hypothetical protein